MAILKAHYRLDETSGLTASDSSDNDYAATLNNFTDSADWVAGDIGGALSWSAGNSYVSVPTAAVTTIPSDSGFSITMRLKDIGSGFVILWGMGRSDTNDVNRAYVSPLGTLSIYREGVTDNWSVVGTTFRDGSWHTLTYTLDYSTNEAKVYVDGVHNATKVHTAGTGLGFNVDGFNLGCSFINTSSNNYQGDMDDVAVYDGVLTANEIESIDRLGIARPLSRVAVVGDLQAMGSTALTDMKDYYLDNSESDQLAAIAMVGDLANTPNAAEFQAIKVIIDAWVAAGIPVLFTLGNHDMEDWATATTRDVSLAAVELPPTSMSDQDSYQASADVTGVDSYCQSHLVTMHDRTDLWITMPWCPTTDQWEFAIAQAALHPSKGVYLLHHAWLHSSGVLQRNNTSGDPEEVSPNFVPSPENPNKNPGATGTGQWEDYAAKIPNLKFITSGHSIGSTAAAQRVKYADSGSAVLNTFVNDQDAPGGGEGFTQFIEKNGDEWRGRSVRTSTGVVSTVSGDKFLLSAVDSLESHYKFNESSGLIASDSSGEGNDGTLVGFTVPGDWVAGALSFSSGTSQQVEIPLSVLKEAYDFSFAMRLKFGDSLNYPKILSGKGFPSNQLRFETYPNGSLSFSHYNNTVSWGITSIGGSVRDGEWHHIAITYDSSVSAVTLYVDGVAISTETVVGSANTPLNFTGPLHIGNYAADPTITRSFYGLMDDFRIYRRRLSAGEVQRLFNPADSASMRSMQQLLIPPSN